jgi:hypothetical protein
MESSKKIAASFRTWKNENNRVQTYPHNAAMRDRKLQG